jgi:formylglycine-generating enzyme required for sulfatase activity/serine/threonine protein kinase
LDVDMPTSSDALQLNTLLGKFLILQQLGKGGMGEVYLAEDTLLKRKVALKTMRAVLAEQPKARKRFLREACSAAAVEHHRIVHINEIGEIGEVVYISMDLLPGQSLEDFLEHSPVPSLKFTLEVIRQVCEGLHAAHTAEPSLIHRDIKPPNTWLKSTPGNKKLIDVKLLDFGLARAAEGDSISQQVGNVMGTPYYMSPEQWRGRDVDARSDLFSVGVMLFEMTTGQKPFVGRMEQIAHQATMEPHPEVRQLNPTLPEEVSQLIDDLLAKDKSARPASAMEVMRRIETIQRELPGDLTLLVGTSACDTEPKIRAHANSSPTLVVDAHVVPSRRVLPWVGMLALGLLLGVGILLLSKNDPKSDPLGGTKTDEKLLAQMKDIEREYAALQEHVGKQPLRTEEDLKREREREAKIDDLQKQLANAAKKEEGPKQLAKNDPKPSPKVVPKKPELLDCTGENGADTKTVQQAQKDWAAYLGAPVETSVDLGDEMKMEFVLIPPGTYWRGGVADDEGAPLNEKPAKKIMISEAFYTAKYEVTRGQFARFVAAAGDPTESGDGFDPVAKKFIIDKKYSWKETGWTDKEIDRHPVVNVSWTDCVEFKDWVEEKLAAKLPEGFKKVRLPREAEWEYAARAGTRTIYANGNDPELLAQIGNVADGTAKKKFPNWTTITAKDGHTFTAPVGKFAANDFGLYDTTGNVLEWCEDWYETEYYDEDQAVINPNGPRFGVYRVLRGGSFKSDRTVCRVSRREYAQPSARGCICGFRVVLVR